ncbi:MAG TPA: barstar family protein [Chthoniobacterales bacterium]|jgi:hypothetical protein
MAHTSVTVDTAPITDWDLFHSVFAKVLGFPAFYGRNLDAWIDCLTSLDSPEDGMTSVHAPRGGVLVLHLLHARDLAIRCPEIYAAIIECSAFVNYRRMEVGEAPVLCLSFS